MGRYDDGRGWWGERRWHAIAARKGWRGRAGAEGMTKSEKKDLTYAEAKKLGFRLTPTGDADRDGVRNSRDCRPYDARRQDNEVDETAAKELELFIENDGDLYRQQTQPIEKNLARKKYRGIYDHDKAVKLYGYLMESGAKKYNKEVMGKEGIPSYFSPKERRWVAERFARDFEQRFEVGEFEKYRQKYQK